MISFKQFLNESTIAEESMGISARAASRRFDELGIDEAFEPFYRWIYIGVRSIQ